MEDDAIIKVDFEVDYNELKTELEEVKKEFDSVKDSDYGAAKQAQEHWGNVKEHIRSVIIELYKADKTGKSTETFIKNIGSSVDSVVQSFHNMRESMPTLFPNAQEQAKMAEVVKQANIEALQTEQKLNQAVQETTQEKIQGEQEVHNVITKNESKAHSQGLLNIEKRRSLMIKAVNDFYRNTLKYTKAWMSMLGSAFSKVGNGFKNLLGSIFNRTGNQASSLFANLKSLLGIAGGIGLYKLGSEAIKTSNDFKNLGNTSDVVARQMSDAFYEAAGDSYNSLVKLSNGTTQVTATLKKFINTWTGQISLMKAQLTAIGSNIGNLLIKVFYPFLVVLNKILAVVNLLVGKLAALFGFNTANMKNILGDIGGKGANNKGMEEYAKATDKAAKKTKKLKDETKKAKEQLQGYDKLNNTTTNDLDDLSDTLDDLSDLGGIGSEGLIDTDTLFDNLMSDLGLVPDWLKQWIDELIELIKVGDWQGIGSKIGQLINKGLYSLNDFLTDFDLSKIRKFNAALLDFINGLIETVNWNVLGRDIAKCLNLITFSIDDLYTQAVQKGTLEKIGKAISNTFKGFAYNFDAEQAGRAATTMLRSILDIVYSSLNNVDDEDINRIADGIHGFISGAFDRLLGISDGEDKSGAQKVGESIAKIINLGLETVGELINPNTAEKAADAIITILNSAIQGLDEERMKNALSGMLQFIGTFFSKLATEINTDDFINKLTNTINNSIENGDVTYAVAGVTKFINAIFDTIKDIVKQLNWKELLDAVWDGIQQGDGVTNWLEFVVLPALFGSLLKLVANAGEWALFGKMLGLKGSAAVKASLGGAVAAGGKGLFAIKNLAGIGGGLTAVIGFLDSVNNGLNKANATATILGATLMGLSMGGPIGGVIGALLAGLAELGVAYEQNTDGFREWVEDKKQQLSLLWPTITDGITAFINNSRISFENWWTENKQGFEQWKVDVSQSIDDTINSIATSFDNFVDDAFTLGENVVKGIADGISDGIKWVHDKVDQIVSDIKDRFSHGLQINSPSRVMRDLAIFIPEGVAEGINDGGSYVDSAVDSMLDSVKFSDFYNESLNETDAFVTSISDKLADIQTPTLDPLKYQSKLLSSPASTARTLSQSYADNAGKRTDGVLAGIYNRMISAGQSSGRNVIVDVYLDKNNRLGQYVIDTVKGNVIMTGGV